MGTHHAFTSASPPGERYLVDGYCPLMIYNTTVLPPRQGSRGHSIGPYVPARAVRPAIERPQVTGLHLPVVSTNIAAAIRNA